MIGLGLLGQLTCQLLHANGCRVFGLDVAPAMVELATRTKVATAFLSGDGNVMTAAANFTGGHGFDAVIITAASASNEPIEQAAELLRKKATRLPKASRSSNASLSIASGKGGRVVVVGAVRLDVPRDPHFYRKELDLRLSCSYGPGRYDPAYEDEGHDYPIGYVRWTEQRNMEAFLELVAQGRLDLKPLITHVFAIDDALRAYDIVLGKVREEFIAILLRYPDRPAKFLSRTGNPGARPGPAGAPRISFIGAGSFAQSYLLPAAKAHGSLETVVTRTGINARNVALKFGFVRSSTAVADLLADGATNTVFIATQHDTHAELAATAIRAGKNVFVEKPLALNDQELLAVIEAWQAKPTRVLVGFNRRFAPLSVAARQAFAGIGEPLVMQFRVNAGFLPADHWTQTAHGGGRILGEVCHFIDLMQFFTGAAPVRVYAECLGATGAKIKNDDNLAVTVRFADGSVGALTYHANGGKALAKERFEISGGGKVVVIDDFKGGEVYRDAGSEKLAAASGKGHAEEVAAFLASVRDGTDSPIPFESLCLTTVTTFRILDALATGLPQEVTL